MKNHTMPDLPCPVCGTLCRADVVLRHKQAISDNAQNARWPSDGEMLDLLIAAGYDADEVHPTCYRGFGWKTFTEKLRASAFPSTGLPAPAPHAELPSRHVVDPTDPTFVKDQAHRDRIEKSPAPHAEVHGVYQLTPQEDATIFGSRATHGEVREALEPFAKIALWRDRYPDGVDALMDQRLRGYFTPAQVRAARAALALPQSTDGGGK